MTRAATMPDTAFPYDDEEFIEVVGMPEYLASTYGRVFSVKSNRFLKPSTVGAVPRVALSNNGAQASLPLPVIVLTAFGKKPPRPNAMPNFLDGNSRNCALDNLEWA